VDLCAILGETVSQGVIPWSIMTVEFDATANLSEN